LARQHPDATLTLVEMMLSHGAASALERLDAERARLAAEQAAV